ncbi:MAG: hypothetical protein ACJ790_08360 [Myxococcaceae bacterium]
MSDHKSDKMEIPHKGHQVELAADRYRTELIATLQELDRRRVEAMDVRGQLLRHKTALFIAGGAVVLLAGAAITASILRSRNEKAVMRRERVRGFIRAWDHPKRVASKAPDRPLPAELIRKFAITFGTALAANYAKKSATAIFATKHPQPAY